MVRLIHPYWCPNGEIPQDMNWPHKERCRDLYHDLIALQGNQHANGGDEDDSDNDDDDGDDDRRRERREYRAFNAEENRVLFDNQGNRRRRSIGFRRRMAWRNAQAMVEQLRALRRNRNEAADRRNRNRIASSGRGRSGRGRSDQRFGSSRSDSSPSTPRRRLQGQLAQMRQARYQRKTNAPSSDWEYVSGDEDVKDRKTKGQGPNTEFISDDEGDIPHGRGVQGKDDMEQRRAALEFMNDADSDLDPDLDLNDPDAADDSDHRSSHRMFVDQRSDTNYNNGNNGDRISRLSTPASSIVDLTNGDNHSNKKDRSSATPNSNGSRGKSVKSEPDVKPDRDVLDAVPLDGSDPDIMFTGANALKPVFQGHGQGSAEDPMVFDD